mgnify:CR=1 FL=1
MVDDQGDEHEIVLPLGARPRAEVFDGMEIKAGEFVWRDPGSRHSAYSPEGGIMLSMFQIPNKFYERDGRITDPNGQDWETAWAEVYKPHDK